jgi:hypothetical protein
MDGQSRARLLPLLSSLSQIKPGTLHRTAFAACHSSSGLSASPCPSPPMDAEYINAILPDGQIILPNQHSLLPSIVAFKVPSFSCFLFFSSSLVSSTFLSSTTNLATTTSTRSTVLHFHHVLFHNSFRYSFRCRSAPIPRQRTCRNEISHPLPLKIPRSKWTKYRFHKYRSLVP